jgi:hypothetical protein
MSKLQVVDWVKWHQIVFLFSADLRSSKLTTTFTINDATGKTTGRSTEAAHVMNGHFNAAILDLV